MPRLLIRHDNGEKYIIDTAAPLWATFPLHYSDYQEADGYAVRPGIDLYDFHLDAEWEPTEDYAVLADQADAHAPLRIVETD